MEITSTRAVFTLTFSCKAIIIYFKENHKNRLILITIQVLSRFLLTLEKTSFYLMRKKVFST